MEHRSAGTSSQRRRLRRLLGMTALAGAVLAGTVRAAEPPGKPASSCVACHTDAERLKVEAAKVPAAPASALQAGKG
jgi:hypothetical protein